MSDDHELARAREILSEFSIQLRAEDAAGFVRAMREILVARATLRPLDCEDAPAMSFKP